MKGVDTIARVRREYLVRGRSIREIARELHISRNTVRKILRSGETEFVYERTVQLVCPHLVARFKSNAWSAWRPWLMKAARPARAWRRAPAACSRGSSVGAAYCSAVASSR